MIKTVFFDLGGVLFTNGTKKFTQQLSKQYNLDQKLVMEIMDGKIGSLYRENRITKDAFWKQAIEAWKIQADADKLNHQWIEGYELIEKTRDIILELKKNGLKVMYLSDNVQERVKRVNERYHFLNLFDDGIFSYEVDIRKPDPRIYTLALEKATTSANESLFIDDKKSALKPAAELGITTILFESPEKLRNELMKMKVLKYNLL